MPANEMVGGYFTIERSIVSLSTREIEIVLGFQAGYLSKGCRVIGLLKHPTLGQFIQKGSTRYSAGHGLDPAELLRTTFIPTAWLNQRLIKVKSLASKGDWSFPNSTTPVEQWELLTPVEGLEMATLEAGAVYWEPRKRGGPWEY